MRYEQVHEMVRDLGFDPTIAVANDLAEDDVRDYFSAANLERLFPGCTEDDDAIYSQEQLTEAALEMMSAARNGE